MYDFPQVSPQRVDFGTFNIHAVRTSACRRLRRRHVNARINDETIPPSFLENSFALGGTQSKRAAFALFVFLDSLAVPAKTLCLGSRPIAICERNETPRPASSDGADVGVAFAPAEFFRQKINVGAAGSGGSMQIGSIPPAQARSFQRRSTSMEPPKALSGVLPLFAGNGTRCLSIE